MIGLIFNIIFLGFSFVNPHLDYAVGFKSSKFEIDALRSVQQDFSLPELSAKQFELYQLDTDTVISNTNQQSKLPIASLTKLMTALIIISENQPTEEITTQILDLPNGYQSNYLSTSSKIDVQRLLELLLISSDNQAALNLALFNAGSINSFVDKMNWYATNLGMNNTQFANPYGQDDPNNYSTSEDLIILTKLVLAQPILSGIVGTTNQSISYGGQDFELISTNKLLPRPDVHGVKTGTETLAGQCLIVLYQNSAGSFLITILGSDDRYQDATSVIEQLQVLSASD